MRHTTLLEIDEIETEVEIDFTIEFGEPVINLMTDIHTGDAIAPDLMEGFRLCGLLNELHEEAANRTADRLSAKKERIPVENIVD